MPTVETLVVGAGHAGLATSRLLTVAGHEHVVLERGRIGERWRTERWDSLRLVTPNWMLRLPGSVYGGSDPDGFHTATRFVEALEDYAAQFAAPVIGGTAVERVRASGRGPASRYAVTTDAETWRVRNLVVATGPHGRPAVPAALEQAGLGDAVLLHARDYRNPGQLPPGGVLVVGASSSGVQIADELVRAGRSVTLAVGRHTRMPRAYRGMDVYNSIYVKTHAWRAAASGHTLTPAGSVRSKGALLHLCVSVRSDVRLLHYLSRCAMAEQVLIVTAHRPRIPETARQVEDSLLRRGAGSRLELLPLDAKAVRRLLADGFGELDPPRIEEIVHASGGLPFAVLELARSMQRSDLSGVPGLSLPTTDTFQRLALLGGSFTTDEVLALSHTSEDDTYAQLEEAVSAQLVEPTEGGYRFRHPLLRERLIDALPPHRRAGALRDVADRAATLGGPPSRLAHLFVAAGLYSRAVPYALRAVETSGALGAYRDALTLIDAVRDHASPEELPHLLARRGDLLQALGEPDAVSAYLEAVPITRGTEHRLVRAHLARAAQMAGEVDIAVNALAGLEAEGDAADGPILAARGQIAFFAGDVDSAWEIANEGADMLHATSDPMAYLDLVTLQGLIAHSRGEWFERFRLELRRTRGRQRLAAMLFDAHLCVAEYVLYGQVPYQELIEDAQDLLVQSDRAGALRGVAFARALIGEAAMLMGDFELAERELTEAVELHHDTDAPAGEAHSLQRLAEVRLAQGDAIEAHRLLQRALPLARWSIMAHHLMHRIYGTMITAATSPQAARAIVDQARSALGEQDSCSFCVVMFAIPASIACSQVGDLDLARELIDVANLSTQTWPGTAWAAALLESRAHLAMAEDDHGRADLLLEEAVAAFESAGQPVDADRCRRTREEHGREALHR